MALNWRWDGEGPHQKYCPRAFLENALCGCRKSSRNDTHVVPAAEDHDSSSGCWCFPSPVDRDQDGDIVWLHKEIEA